ncbi:MAG TPA: hypothetical protein VHL11_17900 [Phototrophicaceae bacterium]|jgi:hypothetical protein|nr:hypothetical protein [Phototrophicaceae bacterium]
MNDELTGQLAAPDWQIPAYAQKALWLETDSGIYRTEGSQGLFQLDAPAQWVTVRWGHKAGPALVRLRWQPDSLDWDGTIRLGGMLDSLHLTGLAALEEVVAVLHLVGRPLQAEATPYPQPEDRQRAVYEPPDFLTSLADEIEDSGTTWLVSEDSPLMSLSHDALMNGLRVWFGGSLAEDNSGWEQFFALPLLLEEVTLFAN